MMQPIQDLSKENQVWMQKEPHSLQDDSTVSPTLESHTLRFEEERMTFLPLTSLYRSVANIQGTVPISRLMGPNSDALNEHKLKNPSSTNGTGTGFSRKDLQNKAWFIRFEELKEYKLKYGNCNVPQKYQQNPSLGIWVNKQRSEYKIFQEGEKSSMTIERRQLLESIGFQWAKQKGQSVWDAKFQLLKEYKAKHGDCAVPTKYTKDQALGRWVSTQREQYQFLSNGDNRCKLTYDNFMKLNELGFIWRVQSERKTHGKNETNATNVNE